MKFEMKVIQKMNAAVIAFRRKRSYINTKPNVLQIILNKRVFEPPRSKTIRRRTKPVIPEKNWNWYAISANNNITWDFIKKNPNIRWDWAGLSANPNITWDIITNNPDKPWHWDDMAGNPNITWDIIADKIPERADIFWYNASCNINITWDIIANNLDRPWHWYWISQHPNITWDIIANNPDKPWDWHGISRNPNITWDIIANNLNKPWDWHGISNYANVTWDIIANNLDKPWNLCRFIRNNNITWGDFKKMDYHRCSNIIPCDAWYQLSTMPNITTDIIMNNLDKPWYWLGISYNSNLTIECIEKNMHKIDFTELSMNIFLWNDTVYKREIAQDIRDRRGRIIEILVGANAAPRPIAAAISRYIDYV